MILFTPLFMAGLGFFGWVGLLLIVSLPVAAGSFFGNIIGMNNPSVMAFIMSLTVGTFLSSQLEK